MRKAGEHFASLANIGEAPRNLLDVIRLSERGCDAGHTGRANESG
jgi:hypothetical protein